MNFSKSLYCAFRQCPKMCWLKKFRPELCERDASVDHRMTVGNEVGDLAMRLFGDFTEVTALREGEPDIAEMTARTAHLMEKGADNICEASFLCDGLYCAVDILRREKGGYAIYEVKSSTSVKDIYLADVAYQKYVLTKCGVNVTGVYIVHIDNSYVLDGELDLHKLFKIVDVGDKISSEYELVNKNLTLAERIMSGDEPQCELSENCERPYKCDYWDYCSRDIVKPSVFDLYGARKKWEYYKKGIVGFDDLLNSGVSLTAIQRRQIEYALKNLGTYIEKDNIRKFLDSLWYPLYFLDFETMQLAVPKYRGTWPYQQIPFQYSLHYILTEGGEALHKEFLAQPQGDPRLPIAQSLCRDIPEGACVLAYNKAFEGTILKTLAQTFPELGNRLNSIAHNLKDLYDPFKNGWYYNRAMGGSFSIKSVLPAVFPNDPSLDYSNLQGVHNGTEAMYAFPLMASMSDDEQQKVRRELLAYCGLDTLAMVKLFTELSASVK